jgi:hypothetical protein
MGSTPESITTDNMAQTSYVVNQPLVSGTDLSLVLTSPTTSSISIPSSQASVTFQWKVFNTGSVTITGFTYNRGWTDCTSFTSIYYPCTENKTWTGTLAPGAFIYLPSGSSTVSYLSTQICFRSDACAIPQPGGCNTYRLRILTVNGAEGDTNLNNNQVDCTVCRLTTATNNDNTSGIDYVEVRSASKLYENPIRYNSIDEAILEKGLNFIYIHYNDGTIEIKKISKN